MSTTEESAASMLPPDDTTVLRFKVDALQSKVEQIRLKASEVSEAAMRAVRAAMKAVGMRGPDPDYPPQDDDIRRLAGIIERLAQRQPDNSYHEGPKDSGLKAIVITCTASILTAGILGGIILSNEFAALRAQVTEWQKATDRRLDQLERRP